MTNHEAIDLLQFIDVFVDAEVDDDKLSEALALAISVLRGGHGERRSGQQRRQRQFMRWEEGEDVVYTNHRRRYAMGLGKGRRKEDSA